MYDKLENWKWYFKETDVKEKMFIKKKLQFWIDMAQIWA